MKKTASVPFKSVVLGKGLWSDRQKINTEVSIRAVYDRFCDTHRFDSVYGKYKEGCDWKPHIFYDSDVAKWLEAAAYDTVHKKTPYAEKVVDKCNKSIEKLTTEDGYFNSYYITCGGVENRFTVRGNHELYCLGHLIEAAVAEDEYMGKNDLLKICARYLDLVKKEIIDNPGAAFRTPGHEEIELALIKLFRHTKNKKYLDMAAFFVYNRGRMNDPAISNHFSLKETQDHLPAYEQTTAEGHAVRAGYLYSAMADLAYEKGDEKLLDACKAIFRNIITKRMYITGGIGQANQSESFTLDYDLVNMTAYAESCAAISLIMFAERMLHADRKSIYADTIERVLYNGFLSDTSLDGKAFFYCNPQAVEPDVLNRNQGFVKTWSGYPDPQRKEVFSCSCCPPNIIRKLAQLGDLVYSYDKKTVFVDQYIASKASFDGSDIEIATDFPKSGKIKISVSGSRSLAVRIPEWCSGKYKIDCSGGYKIKDGYAYFDSGVSEVKIEFDITPRLVRANNHVYDDCGRVAVMRGPVVYCAEGVDNGEKLAALKIDDSWTFTEEFPSLVKQLPVIKCRGFRLAETDELYSDYSAGKTEAEIKLIPYFTFGNRGTSEMRIWLLV